MRKVPALAYWLFWLCVLLMFTFVSIYYCFIMCQLYLYQEVLIFEYDKGMNIIELTVAGGVVLLILSAFIVHSIKLKNIIME